MFVRSRAFSLVDVIVGIGLMMLLFVALFGVLKASLTLSTLAKAKAAAVELAETQMEYMRGLSYGSLGTVGGIPSGTIAQNATTTVDGVSYGVRTLIEYYDDPADGTGAADTTAVTTDYKVGKVVVSYSINGIAKTVSLVSNFVPASIETATGGGTLSIHVVNASGANVSGATVQLINASTSPTVNFTTYTNTSGLAVVGGAATSSQYQIYVSEPGYSSAQTYARAGQNANPNPGYQTVVQNQTTSSTFAIDVLSSLTVSTFSPATTTKFFDTFSSGANLASTTNAAVTGGAVKLSSAPGSGLALAIQYGPTPLSSWGTVSATLATSTGTTAAIHIYDANGNIIPDSVLAGNAAGFTTFPVNISGISTTTYPALALGATLSSTNSSIPAVNDWTLTATTSPTVLPNVTFTLTGAKTIGTTSGGASIYKTSTTTSSGSAGSVTLPLEWDSYSLSVSGYATTTGSSATPFVLSSGASTSTVLYLK